MLSLATFSYAPPAKTAEVHPDRVKQLEDITSKKPLWTAKAHPRFATPAPGASTPLLGVTGDWKADIDEKIASGEIHRYQGKANFVAPDDFDSAEAFPACAKTIGDIRDQSNCGCCWAFGGAEAASDRMCISSNASLMLPLSAQDVCFCSSFNGCGGGMISTPWNYIKSKGAVTGGLYQNSGPFTGMCSDFSLPHCHHHGPQGDDPYPAEGAPGCPSQRSPKCPKACDADAGSAHSGFDDDKYSFDGSIETASGESEIQKMIMEGGPVETAFTVYSDFENYAGGIYHHVTGGMAGGHAVKFVGWGVEDGTKYWKVANSWNPYWGESGYFRIVRGTNEGGIEDTVIGSSASATWGKKSLLGKAA
jgi:cathepsin B